MQRQNKGYHVYFLWSKKGLHTKINSNVNKF